MGIAGKFKDIAGNGFIRQAFTLFSGAFAAQLIPFLATIFLARIYPDAAFGTFFLFSSTLAVLSIVSTLQYELSVVLPDNHKDAINLFSLSIVIAFMVSLLTLVAVLLFRHSLVRLLGDEDLGPWLWALPPAVLLTGIFQALSYWFNRMSSYAPISWARVSRSAAMSLVQTGMGFSPAQSLGLIPGLLAGHLISVLQFGLIMFRRYKQYLKQVSLQGMMAAGRKYRDIPLFNTLLQGMNTVSNQLPIFLLTRFFGPAAAAQYGMANRIIATPMGMVAQSVGQVFYQRGAGLRNQGGDLGAFVRKTYLSLLKFALLPYGLMAVFAPFAFRILFGSGWEEAGILTRFLIPWLFVMFLNSPVSFLITILNKQRQMLVYDTLLLLSRFLSLYLAYHFTHSLLAAVICFSATGMIFNIILMLYLLHVSRNAGT